MSGWIRETAVKDRARPLHLSPEGITASQLGRRLEARWDQVFGVALMPIAAPKKAFVLVPREPPRPPWIEVSPDDLPEGVADLQTLEARIRARVEQSGYRDRGLQRPMLPSDQLMQKVLAREDVPGALEVPVGAGPGGWWRRGVDLLAAGSAGGLLGLYGGALSGSALIAIGVAAAGATVGAALPMAFARNWRSLSRRSKRPRVLVLAPDGCVVGLPTGPEAFTWSEIGSFQHAGEGSGQRLEVRRRGGDVAGSIDAAWFGAPLELITAVAQAYLSRHRR